MTFVFSRAHGSKCAPTLCGGLDQKFKTQKKIIHSHVNFAVKLQGLRVFYLEEFMFQGDIFGGLNDGLLSRAEALAAVDISKHQVSSNPGGLPQLKHDMMYHPGMQHPANSRSQVGDFKVSTAMQQLTFSFFFILF